MPLPTTAVEVEMMLRAYRYRQRAAEETIRDLFPWGCLFDQLWGSMMPRRPHTDDMVQMLDDLGIETPRWTDPRDLTFVWRRR